MNTHTERAKRVVIWVDHPPNARVVNEEKALELMKKGRQDIIVTSALVLFCQDELTDEYDICVVNKGKYISLTELLTTEGPADTKHIKPQANVLKLYRSGALSGRGRNVPFLVKLALASSITTEFTVG